LVAPHQAIIGGAEVDQVNISSTSGDMGILANHVPTIAQLKPGVIEVLTGKETKKVFASGGFAIMNEDSTLNINTVEVFPLEQFDHEAIRRGLADARKRADGSASGLDKAQAEIELEVFSALAHAAGVH